MQKKIINPKIAQKLLQKSLPQEIIAKFMNI